MLKTFNKTILEIRYKPNPAIIDFRGELINKYANLLGLSHWSFGDNRFDIYNEEKSTNFFVSYKNLGVFMEDVPTNNYFTDHVNKFIKNIFNESFMKDNAVIERIVVRTTYMNPIDGKFEELRDKYLKNFISVSDKFTTIVDGEIYDIGCPIIFNTNIGKFKLSSGPMEKEQIIEKYDSIRNNKQNGNLKKEFPDVGLYIDIDYWNNPKSILKATEIRNIISEFYNNNIDNMRNVHKTIMGE